MKYYLDTPGTAEVERLAAKLDALRNGKKKQIILITSSVTKEGKSTVASLLARSIAMHRKNTLLIDFDIRRPTLHSIFNISRENGLVDILQSDLPINSFKKESVIPNLFIISSGILNESPANILKTERMTHFFHSIKSQYNNVIIDSPPLIPVSDSLLLSKFVNDVILVVKAGSTPKYVIKRAINMLKDVNVKVSGIVLNNMQNILPHYYDYKTYGYEYYENEEGEKETKKIVRKHGIWNWTY
jgi:tyrosine-protein kinase Etk/Wzc